MPYQLHPLFEQPDDQNSPIWRFVDFTKFVAMLDARSLYFSRADLLGDPYEGSFARANLEIRPTVYGDMTDVDRARMLSQISAVTRSVVPRTFVNCWSASPGESIALWRIYAGTGKGVAIRSSFSRLVRAIESDETVVGGLVKYVDWDKDWVAEGNTYAPFGYKRDTFAYEKEVRLVIQPTDKLPDGTLDPRPRPEPGLNIPTDLETLIDEVRVSPAAPKWFADLVESVATQYGLTSPVLLSALAGEPVF